MSCDEAYDHEGKSFNDPEAFARSMLIDIFGEEQEKSIPDEEEEDDAVVVAVPNKTVTFSSDDSVLEDRIIFSSDRYERKAKPVESFSSETVREDGATSVLTAISTSAIVALSLVL